MSNAIAPPPFLGAPIFRQILRFLGAASGKGRSVLAPILLAAALNVRAADSADLRRSAFSTPSASTAATLFTRMDPAATGLIVQNLYDDDQMWGTRYREFMGGSMGSGVAAGDFDGDGRVDLYVCTKTKPGRLFRNLGSWKFEDVTDKAGLGENDSLGGWLRSAVSAEKKSIWRQGAVFADVDNDGRLDLYVCRNAAPNLLYLNQGDGTFKEEAAKRGLAIVDGSVIGAFADYDRDGWLDVLVLTNQMDGTESGGRTDRLFHNDGNGQFTEVTQRAGLTGRTFGHAAIWLDYDDDGWPDLYVGNDFSGPDVLYRNNRDGTFTNVLDSVVPHTPYSSMGADAGDINNDGYFDLMVADMATTSREKDRRGLVASRNDVLNSSIKAGVASQYTRNALFLNTGRGAFREVACWAGLEATDWTWSLRFEDFDNDGWTDLHVTNGMVREANNHDVLAEMMRALSDAQRIAAIKKSPPLNESNLAFRNLHGEGFQPVAREWGLDEVGISFGAATADLDGDGDLDLVYLNHNGGLSVFRNDVAGPHRVQIRLRGTRSNRQGVGAVVRIENASGLQARPMIVARGYTSGSELVAHFGLGADPTIKRLVVEWPSGITQTFSDLAADAAYLVTENGPVSKITARPAPALFEVRTKELGLNVKDESQLAISDKEQVFLPFRTDRGGPGIAVADLDGDGHDDLYLSATTGSPARVLRWTNGVYVAQSPAGLPAAGKTEDGPPLFLDADQNGTPDLLVTKASANAGAWPAAFSPVLYSNDGHGGFTATGRLPALALNVGAVCAADIDGDGDLDLFLGGRSVPGRYPERPPSALLRNDGGHFVDATGDSPALAKPGLVKSALFRDVDGDGRPDLVVALEWDYVRYFHNDGHGRFSDQTEKTGFASGGRGWWNGLASADFNGDGRPDFVVGNLGQNTTYRATAAQPATLLYGDFARNGTKLLAEAVYEGDRRYPLRSRADLGARLPPVLRKFPKNNVFAKATLEEVFGPDTLAAAEVYQADNLSSGVFLSQPDGTYRFAPLPRIAQMSSMQGLVAADLDGDGLADLCAVQNSDISIPRFEGGVGIFLKGQGDGSFSPWEPAQSGIFVPDNGRALVMLDPAGTGRPDLFLTRHGASAEFLANQATTTRWLDVRLRGGKANPDAVGAKVKIVYSNRPPAYHEIGLGGGWFSQGTPCLFVAVPPDGRIVEAAVTWPDGQTSRATTPPAQGLWIIQR